MVHLFDACERFGPKPIYCHHEQAAAFAAGAYARIHGYGACIVTTGPGGTNALTPALGAWQNYTPVMFISGQVRFDQSPYGTRDRVTGMQSAPILDLVQPITKWGCMLHDTRELPDVLDDLYKFSVESPCGPVWLDVPLDRQWQEV